MFRLVKRFGVKEWLLTLVLVGFVLGQVYFDLELATYSKNIMEEMTNPLSTTKSILAIGGEMLLIALGSMVCTIIVGFIAAFVSSKLSFKLRGEVYHKVAGFSVAEIDKFSTPGLITRTTNDIMQVQMATIMLLRVAVSAPITAIGAILKIQSVSIPLTLAAAGWIVLMVSVIGIVFGVAFPKFRRVQKLTDKLNGVTRENLTGIRVVRAYNAEDYQEEKFEQVNGALTKTQLVIARVMSVMFPALMFIMNGITLTVYWLGAGLINGSAGSFGFADLTAFSNLAMQVLSAFMMLTMLFVMVPRASVSAGRINEVLETPFTVVDKEQTTPLNLDKGGEIDFKNVYFKYPDADGWVLEDINFSVKKGETLAVIGATGSGKTTLVNLIPRLFDATEGEVLVNGVNVKDASQKELHSIIGYVPQKSLLFSGTIKDNICFSGEYNEAEMERSARAACAEEFIMRKENGYDGEISQGGKNVSGGQKQRLSIARAVQAKPQFFIFDDSFSALDYKTDKTVRKNLKEIASDTTKIIVAQRIGTIKDADKIIVLEKGKIVGMGTHGELLNNCEVYKNIALSQLSKEELGI